MGILKSFETKTESLKSTLKYKMQWCKRNCVLSLEMPPGLIGLWSFDKQALFSIICTKANIYISLSVYQWTCVCISKTGWQISSFLSVRKDDSLPDAQKEMTKRTNHWILLFLSFDCTTILISKIEINPHSTLLTLNLLVSP